MIIHGESFLGTSGAAGNLIWENTGLKMGRRGRGTVMTTSKNPRRRTVGPVKLRGAAVLVAVLLLGLSSAVAQEYRGTAEQQSACMSDVFRLCSSEIPDVGRIVACLKREKPRLSDGCRSVFGGASTRYAAHHRGKRHQRLGSEPRQSGQYSRYGYQTYQGYQQYQSWY